MGIKILQGGALTTVQDAGRIGYQNAGFSVSGVMDYRSFRMANMLLGNEENEAVLEVSLMGPAIAFTEDNTFAITGGDFSPTLNGKEIALYAAIPAKKGDTLRLGLAKEGARAYIAFAGGMDIPVVMGSKSTNLKCRIGGYKGRKLETGDEIAFANSKPELINMYKRYEHIREFQEKDITLRVVLGPQTEYFSEEGIRTFLESEYTVSEEYDRMGCRLKGPAIASKNGVDIISDGIALGSIQIPTSGTPIIMMADRQTTGGYAKIATVVRVDIPKLAQRTPGNKIRFREVTVEEAAKLYKKEERELKRFYRKVN